MIDLTILTDTTPGCDANLAAHVDAGSVCSSHLSQPLSTDDVDIVIDATKAQIEHFLSLLGDQFYSTVYSAAKTNIAATMSASPGRATHSHPAP